MIEYIRYQVSGYTEDTCSHLFDDKNEAVKYKKEIIQDIINGKFDSNLKEQDNFGFGWFQTENDIDDLRKNAVENVLLKKVYHTPSGIIKRTVMLSDNETESHTGIEIVIKSQFPKENYTVKLGDKDDLMYVEGGMICDISPWGASGIPLRLSICICPDGGILHRGWEWSQNTNYYLHTNDKTEELKVTPEMIDTVNGLFSGRIKFNDLKIAVGGTVQDICPINIEEEEKKIGQKIYLA